MSNAQENLDRTREVLIRAALEVADSAAAHIRMSQMDPPKNGTVCEWLDFRADSLHAQSEHDNWLAQLIDRATDYKNACEAMCAPTQEVSNG